MAVGIPSISSPDLLDRCLSHVFSQRDIQADVLIVQNGRAVEASCLRWERLGVSIHRPWRNLGVAASWNVACRWAWAREHDAILLINEDMVLLAPHTLTRFRALSLAGARRIICLAGRGFSAVCVTRVVWEEVGQFDEGFWPAYYEDCDMQRRCTLAGIGVVDIDVPSDHVRAAAIRSDETLAALNRIAEPVNRARYVLKWGGAPEHEVYATPWNDQQPAPCTRDVTEGKAVLEH